MEINFKYVNSLHEYPGNEGMRENKPYQLCFQHPGSELKSQLFPSQSFQVCAGHIGLCKLMISVEQTHLVCNHCKRFPLQPKKEQAEDYCKDCDI